MINIFSSIGLFVQFIFFRKLVPTTIFAFDMRMRQEISKRENGNNRLLGMAKYNTYFKNNFNLLIMNVTQINFIFLQNLRI